jgi:hypothetical protein
MRPFLVYTYMAKIFDIINGDVVITAEALAIPAFKTIWDNDKSKSKGKATNEIKYVAFLCDHSKSPYRDFPEYEKEALIKKDVFGVGWQPDVHVKEACTKYLQLTETPTMRLLRASKSAVDKLAIYLESVDFDKLDSNGKPYSARDVVFNLGNIGNLVKSLNVLETAVRMEQTENTKVQGGTEIGYFEDSDNE